MLKENIMFKILASIPVILISLYFIPFLGVILLIFRYFVYRERHIYEAPIVISVIGLLIFVPELVNYICGLFNFKIEGLTEILNSDSYISFIPFGRRLIVIGIIFLIINYIVKLILIKITNGVSRYIQESEAKDAEIREKNDLKMREKREAAKNTHVIKCPYCGSETLVSGNTTMCKYCRRNIVCK